MGPWGLRKSTGPTAAAYGDMPMGFEGFTA